MTSRRGIPRTAQVLLLTIPMFAFAGYLWAHCDGLDGPVVKAAEKALATGNVNFALIWVQPSDETELRNTFRQALAVRALSPEAKNLADRHFFETIVRLHRSGEGAPYTGLQPSGRDLGPAIPAADRAVESGDVEAVAKLLTDEVKRGLTAHFTELRTRRSYDVDDVAKGREYVKAYVEFIHYVERIHDASVGASEGHYPEAETH
jgi:hypothetical protein